MPNSKQTSVVLAGGSPATPLVSPTSKVVVLVDRSWDDPGREYELDRLVVAARELGLDLRVVDIHDLELFQHGDTMEVRELLAPVPPSARVLVRLGARATDQQLAVLQMLESAGVVMEATPDAIRVTQHKLLTAFEISDIVSTPATLLTSNAFNDDASLRMLRAGWRLSLGSPAGTATPLAASSPDAVTSI